MMTKLISNEGGDSAVSMHFLTGAQGAEGNHASRGGLDAPPLPPSLTHLSVIPSWGSLRGLWRSLRNNPGGALADIEDTGHSFTIQLL